MKTNNIFSRRDFLKTSGIVAGSTLMGSTIHSQTFSKIENPDNPEKKLTVALVGTGSRGCEMWGRSILKSYGQHIEFVGLCDINPGHLEFAKKFLEVSCPTYTDFEKMMKETNPELLIVCTVDATHHEFIIKGMEMGANILTEKPMTTDEKKIQAILDAEKRTGKHCRVTFNYRYSPHRAKMWELLHSGEI